MARNSPDAAIVLDAAGRRLSPCPVGRARALVVAGRADLVAEEPLTIRLQRAVEMPEPRQKPAPAGRGKRILLHTCCGPCAAYPVKRLRDQEFEVSAFWYNPNVQPFCEHERRREALGQLAAAVNLPVLDAPGYELVPFLRAVCGHEAFGERCRICYRLRLERTAQVAREQGHDAFTTTLLISIHQDEGAIREVGEQVGSEAGVPFHYERFRCGWGERGRLASEHGLYRQDYCGCIYSEWERRRGNP